MESNVVYDCGTNCPQYSQRQNSPSIGPSPSSFFGLVFGGEIRAASQQASGRQSIDLGIPQTVGKAAKYELVSQQVSPQQPVGLGISSAAGTAVKNELASQQVSPQQPVGLEIPQAAGTAAKYELVSQQANSPTWFGDFLGDGE